MAEKAAKKDARGASGSARAGGGKSAFTPEERAAMRERAREQRAGAGRGGRAQDGERDVLAKIAEMPEPDRAIAGRIHELVRDTAPALVPRTWYGMPAYARDGKVLCFFQASSKFKTRYGTLGFSDGAALDEGAMWPTSYAVVELTAAVETRIRELVAQAAG